MWMLAGCTAGGGGGFPTDTDPVGACSSVGGEYTPASTANFAANGLIVNGVTVVTDVANITGCVKAEGGGAAWLINDSNGNPFMTVVNESTATGAVSVLDGVFVIDMYGNVPPIVFQAEDFYTEQWAVNALDPFSVAFTGQATTPDGHQLDINYIGTAAP